MKKQYLLILANLILIGIYIHFVYWRLLRLEYLYESSSKEIDFSIILTRLDHEWIVLALASLSLIGAIFWNKSKFFFWISTLYISTQCVMLFLAPSLSVLFFIKLIAVVAFLWLLIYENGYSVYVERGYLKLLFLFFGIFLYLLFFYNQ